MKKWIALLCALLMICAAATAAADSSIIKPSTSETFKALVGGKSFEARITGWGSYGEDEDTKYTITITVCERDRFDAAAIENLAAGDILLFGDGTAAVITEVTFDEYGAMVKGSDFDAYSFYKNEDGTYIATTDYEYPFYTEIFSIEVPLEKDIAFLDWSDPENLDAPVKLGFDALIDHLLEDTNFSEYNTKVTFDENGKLVEFLYNYSPWN